MAKVIRSRNLHVNNMKQIITLLFLTIFSVGLSAQSDLNTGDGSEGGTISRNLKKVDSQDRLILEFTHNNWGGQPDSLKTKWFSRGFNMYFMYDLPLFGSNNVSIAPGIGIENTNVYHNSLLLSDTIGSYFEKIPDTLDYKKGSNKLAQSFVDVPFELRFRTNPNTSGKTFKVALGFRVGMRINGHTKYVGDNFAPGSPLLGNAVEGEDIKFKNKKVPNLSRFRYAATVRLGYGNVNIFGLYNLSTVFDGSDRKGLHAWSVGLTFNPF